MLKKVTFQATFIALCTMLSTGAYAIADTPKQVDIPAGELSTALLTLSKQYGADLVYRPEQVHGFRTHGAHGSLTTAQAATQLLQGTPLELRTDSSGAMLIASPTSGSAQGATPTSTSNATRDPSNDPKEAGKQSSQDFRVAQVDQTNAGTQAVDSDKNAERKKKDEALAEIVVTGTHIRNTTSASPITEITDVDIANSGYSTVGDVIRSLPQSFGGGVNPGVVGATGTANAQNISGASTVNLRGLGSDATLTLINGHRIAYDGFTPASDISVIPLAAIQRIEIITDSASAIYGSDAVAGVANFILRRDFQGAETSASTGTSTRGGATDYEASQLLGTTWASGSALLSYEHFGQQELYSTDRSFSENAQSPTSLLPYQRRDSVFVSAQQELSDRNSVYVDALYTNRVANSVVSEEQTVGFYTVNTTTAYSVATGLQSSLTEDWMLHVDADLSRSRDQPNYFTATNGMAQPLTLSYFANRDESIEAHADGNLVTLPAGPLLVALGVGYRHEAFEDGPATPISATRGIKYAYSELRIPLILPDTQRVGLERLEFSASGRYEDYSDFGSTTTPKLGIIYSPVESLMFRGTWGRAFRAPSLLQLHGQTEVEAGDAIYVGGAAGDQVLITSGSNPNLQPERANTWAAGFDFKPQQIPQLTTNFTYFNIDYKNRILAPFTDFGNALTNPAYTPFIGLNPSAALQASLISAANIYLDYTAIGHDPAKTTAILYDSDENAVQQTINGVDVSANYRASFTVGDFDFSGNASWMHFREQLTSTSSFFDVAGTIFNPPKLRTRVGATWQRGSWGASTFVNYTGSETDNTTTPFVGVASWTTVDAQLRYSVPAGLHAIGGLRISLSVQNLFDRSPPFLQASSTTVPGLQYDSTNASPLGRFVSLTLTQKW